MFFKKVNFKNKIRTIFKKENIEKEIKNIFKQVDLEKEIEKRGQLAQTYLVIASIVLAINSASGNEIIDKFYYSAFLTFMVTIVIYYNSISTLNNPLIIIGLSVVSSSSLSYLLTVSFMVKEVLATNLSIYMIWYGGLSFIFALSLAFPFFYEMKNIKVDNSIFGSIKLIALGIFLYACFDFWRFYWFAGLALFSQ